MPLQPTAPREPIPDVQTSSQDWKLDPELIIEHHDLYSRSGDSEFGKLTFDNDQNEQNPPNPREVTVESDATRIEKVVVHKEQHKKVPQIIFAPTDGLSDGTDMDHYMEPDAEMISDQPNPNITNRGTTKLRS